MATQWVETSGSLTATAAQTLGTNNLIYNNSRTVSGTITLEQKVTVVAAYLFGITTTDDTWSMSLIVDDETVTPTYLDPYREDRELKGKFYFARGPLLYQPRRLISIPVESSLTFRLNKEQGGNSSTISYHAGFLLQKTL